MNKLNKTQPQNKMFEQLIDLLTSSQDISEWQLYTNNYHVLEAGFVEKELGMIYTPIQTTNMHSLDYLVKFNNGHIAQGSVNPHLFTDAAQIMAIIKSTATPLSSAPNLARIDASYEPPTLGDAHVSDMVANHPETIVDLAQKFMSSQLAYNLDNLEGQVRIKSNNLRFANSSGAQLESHETGSSYLAEYNAVVDAYEKSVGMVKTSDLQRFALLAEYAQALKQPKIKLKDGNYKVIFDPGYGFGLLDTFILKNIAGSQVEAGVGRFAKSDFTSHKPIAHSKFDLSIDQTLPLNTDSFSFNKEGIVGQKFDIIRAGKLTEPICNLQSAQKLGVAPRALSSLAAAQLVGQKYQEFIKTNSTFILILSVLGLHTQNEVLGNYSLPSPSALYFEDGQLVGPVSCIITGDMFAKLMSPELGFVQLDAYNKPSLFFDSDVTFKTA